MHIHIPALPDSFLHRVRVTGIDDLGPQRVAEEGEVELRYSEPTTDRIGVAA